ncbi:hypothetical protein PLICRDRAFT_30587 [Plicaturopsis crispa FD-325 SS-3]|nr:hypothetical protein PLICRDRAFT_30587 [Plicaturopsis crispa FD-325 SS-3]
MAQVQNNANTLAGTEAYVSCQDGESLFQDSLTPSQSGTPKCVKDWCHVYRIEPVFPWDPAPTCWIATSKNLLRTNGLNDLGMRVIGLVGGSIHDLLSGDVVEAVRNSRTTVTYTWMLDESLNDTAYHELVVQVANVHEKNYQKSDDRRTWGMGLRFRVQNTKKDGVKFDTHKVANRFAVEVRSSHDYHYRGRRWVGMAVKKGFQGAGGFYTKIHSPRAYGGSLLLSDVYAWENTHQQLSTMIEGPFQLFGPVAL